MAAEWLKGAAVKLCNMSEYIFREGFCDGFTEGIKGAVEILKECGAGDQKIVKGTMEQYHLTPEEAERFVHFF